MPQLQWLGTLPKKKNYLAEALEGGMESYISTKEKKEERELKLEEISFDKKKSAADIVIKAIGMATPQQKEKLLGEGSQPGALILDVYGQEALNTLKGVSGKGKADKLAEVGTWIDLQAQPNRLGRAGQKLSKEKMDREVAFKLNDTAWKTTYPSLATKFEKSYKDIPKKKEEGWRWSDLWGKKGADYSKMGEQELFNKAKAGDEDAKQEAIRRGYPVGGR